MPDALQVKAEYVDSPEKRNSYTVGIVGYSKEGLSYALAFATAGYTVKYTDRDQYALNRIAKGATMLFSNAAEAKLKTLAKTGRITVINDLEKTVSGSNVIVIAIPLKFDEKGFFDDSEVKNVCKQIGTSLRKGSLVIYGCITGVGFIESTVKRPIEDTSSLKTGEDYGLAYCISETKDWTEETAEASQFYVAAYEKRSLQSAATFMETLTKKEVKLLPDLQTAELAILFMAAHKDVSMALTNELSAFCEKTGQDYYSIIEYSGKHENSTYPTLHTDENRNVIHLLMAAAENAGVKLRLLEAARQTNELMVKRALTLVKEALDECGKSLRRAKVSVIGMVASESASHTLVKMLEAKGAKVSIYETRTTASQNIDFTGSYAKTVYEAAESADCIVLVTGRDWAKRLNLRKLHTIMKMPAAIVDLTASLEQDKVEKAEFIYRSLGRGNRRK
jgi:nucleotide sugar dehydrogenase